jgi:hypothetical protein
MSFAPTPLVITYIDPDGNTWNLSDRSMSNGYVCSAIAGIEGFPFMMQTIPFLDGTALANIYIPQPGTIGLAVLVSRPASDVQNDYYTTLDALVRAFITRRNEIPMPGKLIIQRPDGTSRQISTYTTSGLDTPEVGLNDMSLYSFSLSTPDPYWSDLNPNQFIFALAQSGIGILPLLPIAFDGVTIVGTNIVNNQGTSLSFPTWIITGPGTPKMTNNTTGLSWSLSAPVPAGHQVQVTTARGQQSVVDITNGANLWSNLVAQSPRSLWPLVSGNNSVTVTLTGATVASSVVLDWTNRWSRA